ncbi:hypothetical protein [Alteribacillus sp. HJP-4]|uniref:hypothetical protein n=1 Tax=Alteribacillus sp. HJP-4 TaxID=2775394 RepID=UPI0035CD22BD
MDVLLIFMLLASVSPLIFWRRGYKWLSVIQFALMLGMWDYFYSHFTSITLLNAPTSVIAFYGSLALADVALIMLMITFFKELEIKQPMRRLRSELQSSIRSN